MSLISINDTSVIIPYFRAKTTILKTIHSVIDAGFKESQITIIDDYSNDGIINQIVKKRIHIKCIKNTKNFGAAYCRNVGILKTHTKYILFIDSDIHFSPNNLKTLLLNKNTADIIFPKILYDDNSIMNPQSEWEKNYCMCSAIFVVKKKSLSLLDEFFDKNYLIYGEDSDFFMRCKSFGLSFEYIWKAVVRHPKKTSYSENIYYLRTRNSIYFSLKNVGIIKYKNSILIYLIIFTFYNFATAILNKNIQLNPFKIQNNIKYSTKRFARIRLFYLFVKAFVWNIKNISLIIQKRKKLIKKLNTYHLSIKDL